MIMPRRPRFFAALAAAFLLMAAGLSALAETFKFPADEPTFSITLPEGWTCKHDKDGDATCQEGNDATYQIQILALNDAIKDNASVKSVLEEVLQQVNAKLKMQDAAIGKAYDYKNVNKINFTGQQSHGLVDGVELYITGLVFAPKKGQYFMVEFIGAGPAKGPNEKVSSYVLNSITTIK